MNQQNIAIISYVIISLVAIIILTVLLSRKKKNCQSYSEKFKKCICSQGQSGREENCQDTTTVNNLYVTNKLTEFSKLPDRDWSKVNSGDANFPSSKGCYNSPTEKQWVEWDFTDFGS